MTRSKADDPIPAGWLKLSEGEFVRRDVPNHTTVTVQWCGRGKAKRPWRVARVTPAGRDILKTITGKCERAFWSHHSAMRAAEAAWPRPIPPYHQSMIAALDDPKVVGVTFKGGKT